VYKHGELLGDLTIAMAGKHNLLNALAALATALEVGVSFEVAAEALKSFKGVDRRFTYKGTFQGAEVIDDYGHHPTEIHNTLLVARKRAKGKLIMVFQPQRFSRTQLLWDDFVNLFASSTIDELIITDIIPGPGEIPRAEISTQALVKAIQTKHPGCPITYIPQSEYFTEIQEFLAAKATKDDLILLQGAGKVTKLGTLLTQPD
jgi:UDP-N-acetylmuramate--alanine ligase